MSDIKDPSAIQVLVADDDASSRLHLKLLLERFGIVRVVMAEDGRQALERIDGVALLFLDVMMPGMDGVEVVRQLADRGFDGEIILVTGSTAPIRDMAELLTKSLGLRLRGTVRKPIDTEALRELLP
ncbi:response regulator [Endothiovibrio diazotrophicus]